ncbi:hypothetical protein [Microbacter margulisiae]|uniref:Putative membrane protein YgcG n=1 Tax=Microbacter margulisiae TaxID=1350067 RepID=A0A7W5H1L1_9PORP|nr:hypothetical protein [Microbacter margulisiae]MBB3186482.1 putative membrane protein YgcG [Microbacter margulisiae]
MKTKLGILSILMLLPVSLFSQSFYDDIYNPKAAANEAKKQVQQPTQTTQNNQEYQIETSNVGNQQAVVVRNAAGDTVYYSGDYANRPDTLPNDTTLVTGKSLLIQPTTKPNLWLQYSDGSTYPVDNVNWNINVWGGSPYYAGWWGQPFWYNSFYPFGYAYNPYYWGSWYGDYWDTWDMWDPGFGFGLGFSWNYPYYYGAWGGYPYYYGGNYPWAYRHSIPYNYSENSRRAARMGTLSGAQLYSTGIGSRAMSGGGGTALTATPGARATLSNTGSRVVAATRQTTAVAGVRQVSGTGAINPVNVRGTAQNRVFWTNVLRQSGYNVPTTRAAVQYQNRNYIQPNNSVTTRRVVIMNNRVQNVESNNYRYQRSTPVQEQRVYQQQQVERPVYNETRSFNEGGGGGRSFSGGGGGGGFRGGRR